MTYDPTTDEGNNAPIVWVDGEGITHYRASALGGCTTALIIVRSGFESLAPPKSMQERWNEGHLHEPDIVRRANTEYGLEVFAKDPATNKQWAVCVPVSDTIVIDGHTDGKVVGHILDVEDPDAVYPGEERGFEAKTMSSEAYKRWVKMTWEERWRAYPGYAMQLTVYGRGMGVDRFVYGVKDKEAGTVTMEAVDGLPYDWNLIKAKIAQVEAHVRQGLPIPEECFPKKQWPCPVYYIGPCGEDKRDTLAERENEIVLALAVTYDQNRDAENIAKKAKETARDEIKKHLPEGGKFDVEGWKIAFTKRTSKGSSPVERFDMEQFVADHPELAEQYTTTEQVETWTTEKVNVTAPRASKS